MASPKDESSFLTGAAFILGAIAVAVFSSTRTNPQNWLLVAATMAGTGFGLYLDSALRNSHAGESRGQVPLGNETDRTSSISHQTSAATGEIHPDESAPGSSNPEMERSVQGVSSFMQGFEKMLESKHEVPQSKGPKSKDFAKELPSNLNDSQRSEPQTSIGEFSGIPVRIEEPSNRMQIREPLFGNLPEGPEELEPLSPEMQVIKDNMDRVRRKTAPRNPVFLNTYPDSSEFSGNEEASNYARARRYTKKSPKKAKSPDSEARSESDIEQKIKDAHDDLGFSDSDNQLQFPFDDFDSDLNPPRRQRSASAATGYDPNFRESNPGVSNIFTLNRLRQNLENTPSDSDFVVVANIEADGNDNAGECTLNLKDLPDVHDDPKP